MTDRSPNVILINCDDLGYGDLGSYGSKINKTPNLDRMAEEGVRFTDFYMASPVCSPSRGAMMTGCYPRRIGFGSFDDQVVLFPGDRLGLHENEITIADLLKESGYSTMIIGKWHCGDQKEFLPTRHGFDHYYGIPFSNDMGRQAGRNEDMNLPPLPLMLDEEVIQEQPDQTSITERYIEKAVSFIRDSKDNPFFLYLAHMHVHLPLYAPDRFLKQSDNGDYGATVECVDWSVGVIVDELRRQNLDEDTLIIFTSDNGARGDYGGSNGPLRGGKGTTWEGGMRVPCIMYWPGTIEGGRVSDELITSLDFLPTLAGLAGNEAPKDRIIDGLDITDIILDKDAKSEREAFFYYFKDNLKAVRVGDWKLHLRERDKGEIKELYNLRDDIGETRNLYDERPDIVEKLLVYVEECRKDIGDMALGIEGENIRPIGVVDNAKPLTEYNPDHPYIIAMYDKEDAG